MVPEPSTSSVYVHAASLSGMLTGDCLSPEEASRAAAFHFDEDRLRYRECHERLRRDLAGYARQSPAALEFCEGPFGKPTLQGGSWHFNLSHAGSYYAAAFCEDHPIGIDIETGANLGDPLELVSHVCDPLEAAKLRRLEGNPGALRRLFLCYWTAKEAFLKAIGCGFQVEPHRIRITGDFHFGWGEVVASISGADAGAWQLHFLHVSDVCVLTVATPRTHQVVVRESPFDA